jgi:hypothetical protein
MTAYLEVDVDGKVSPEQDEISQLGQVGIM